MAGFFSLLSGSRASFGLFYSSSFKSVLYRLKRQISSASLYLVDCYSLTFYPTTPYPCLKSLCASYIRILTFYFCLYNIVGLCGYFFFSGITSCNLTSLRTLPFLLISWISRASALTVDCVILPCLFYFSNLPVSNALLSFVIHLSAGLV